MKDKELSVGEISDLYTIFDDLVSAEKYEDLDNLLNDSIVEEQNIDTMICYLIASNWCLEELKHRKKYLKKVKKEIKKRGEWAKGLLDGID